MSKHQREEQQTTKSNKSIRKKNKKKEMEPSRSERNLALTHSTRHLFENLEGSEGSSSDHGGGGGDLHHRSGLQQPRGGRLMHSIAKQSSIRDLSKYLGVVDGASLRELSETETHELIPGMLGFKSAHTLINKERMKHGRRRLTRSIYLDKLCQGHAQRMAASTGTELMHSVNSTDELRELVNSNDAGENIQRGPSVEAMHLEAMSFSHRSAYKNIIGEKFTQFGIGTALGKDGKLYMAQLFRGPEYGVITTSDEVEETKRKISVVSEFLKRASFWMSDLAEVREGEEVEAGTEQVTQAMRTVLA